MRRVFAILFFIVLFFLAITTLVYIIGITKFDSITKQETSITNVILITLELIGILAAIAVIFIILVQYFRYRRPYRLVFDAFSNEPDLISNAKKPLNLSILVQEELIRQFKIIYSEVNGYADKKEQSKKRQYYEALVADELYIEEGPSSNGMGSYVSVDQVKKGGMVEDLKEVIQHLQDPKGVNLMSLVGEIVPKDVAPVSKIIEAIIPPHVIKATAFLQWRSNAPDDSSAEADKVGITFKYVDLSNQRNLMVRTLWWQPPQKLAETANAATPAKVNNPSKTTSNKGADRYVELLSPASHWMALMFWEQKLLSNVPPINRVLKKYERRRQARIFYLMGALYYARADQFPEYKSFFCQLAVEHFRQASITDVNWNLPYLYLANLYTFKVHETTGEKSEKLREDAQKLYNDALEYTPKGHEHTRQRILIAKSLAELAAGIRLKDEERFEEANQHIEEAVQLVEKLQNGIDPAIFDPTRADCAAYLYNLATWYVIAFDKFVPVNGTNSRNEARRYLAYSLARSPGLRETLEKDKNFESMCISGDLGILFGLLDEARKSSNNLAKLTGEEFKCKLDPIPRMIDQQLKRPELRQEA